MINRIFISVSDLLARKKRWGYQSRLKAQERQMIRIQSHHFCLVPVVSKVSHTMYYAMMLCKLCKLCFNTLSYEARTDLAGFWQEGKFISMYPCLPRIFRASIYGAIASDTKLFIGLQSARDASYYWWSLQPSFREVDRRRHTSSTSI